MKPFTLRLGAATIRVDVTEHDHEPEFPGELLWESNRRAELEVWKLYQYNSFGEESSADLLEESHESNPDSFIGALCAMGKLGGHWELTWEGACAFWLFHDVSHALEDFSADADERAIYSPLEIEEKDEMRAHAYALEKYLKHGGQGKTAVKVLMEVAQDHAARFGV